MRVCLIGGSGRIGRHALLALADAGHEIVAVARSPLTLPDGAVQVSGDARDRAVIGTAVTGCQAVISALGPQGNRPEEADALEAAMTVLVASMTDQGVPRLVTLSGAGVTVPGDDKPAIDRVASRLVGLMARHVLAAKQREHAVLSASGLDWTALRPPIVTDGDARGYRLSDRLSPMARVTRADVGLALADQVADDRWIRRSPFVLPAV